MSDCGTFESLIEQTVDLDAIERHEYIVSVHTAHCHRTHSYMSRKKP